MDGGGSWVVVVARGGSCWCCWILDVGFLLQTPGCSLVASRGCWLLAAGGTGAGGVDGGGGAGLGL